MGKVTVWYLSPGNHAGGSGFIVNGRLRLGFMVGKDAVQVKTNLSDMSTIECSMPSCSA